MQSATTLIERVQGLVKDGSFGSSFILEKLNDGLAEVVQLTQPPDLVVVDAEVELASGDKTVSMPSDFYGPRILRLDNYTDDVECSVCYRFSDFAPISRKYRGTAVRATLLKGKTLLVAGIPSVTTMLHATYLKEPTIFASITDDGKKIGYLPFRLGEQAIVNYAAWRMYLQIEDGIDGRKVNSEAFESEFMKVVAKIIDHFGMEATERDPETVHDMIGISGSEFSRPYFTGNL